MTGPAVPSDEELRSVLCREIREASWTRGIAMLDSDVAAFRDALLPVVRRYADLRAAEELRGALARALTDPHTYGESVQRLGHEIAGCHICVAGSASEGDTQDAIERHRAHRARADALTREATT